MIWLTLLTPPTTVATLKCPNAAVGAETVGDLHRQFTGRRQHERTDAARRRPLFFVEETIEDRQGKSGGFAGAGLGDAQQIAALEQGRNRLRLDRRWIYIALLLEGAKQYLGKAEVGKLCH